MSSDGSIIPQVHLGLHERNLRGLLQTTGSVLNKKVLKQRDTKQTIDISVKKTEKPADTFLEFPPKPNAFTQHVS
ncbi:hypothetical protein PFLUV_G00085720 [Perca fluviatilis]|uniref:Uncharacterized protein n=1 Tax=Perca fluviatilis TaxID=8168 RepID=A0A6A5F9I0_PERFL|nr:hypothetical protein PFLUV_G00085720 [Perca fluviatilis]